MIVFKISSSECNQTVISFLRKRFKTTPLSLIYKLFRRKKVKIDEKIIRYYHHRLIVGNKLEIFDNYLKKVDFSFIYPLSKEKECFLNVYEDENLIIVLKDYGITMSSLDNSVRNYLFNKSKSEYDAMMKDFFILSSSHRLDKPAKGLVIYTKKYAVKREICKSISDKTKIEKKYFALIENNYNFDLDFNNLKTIEGYIKKDDEKQRMFFYFEKNIKKSAEKHPNFSNEFKFCSLEFLPLNKKLNKKIFSFFPPFSKKYFEKKNIFLLEIKLHTGRKHQIRSILSFLKIPIVGDKKYGSLFYDEKSICLIAYKISFNNLSKKLSYLNKKSFSCFDKNIIYY